MTQITVNEDFQPNKYLLVSRVDETQSIQTTRILISDDRSNTIKVVSIEQGPQGETGATGPSGLPGQDAPTFDVLPVNSGGTNNTTYTNGNIIFFDGEKLASTSHTVQDILDTAGTSNSVTGVLAGSGLRKIDSDNTVTLDTLLGEGLTIGSSNEIVVDGTIARTSELDLGTIGGQVPISKGGTNNNFYTQNRLVYFDGTKIKSFPINTGNFLLSGVSVNIVAGSGLVGGGGLEVPNGTVAINIPSSADIIVEDDLIKLSTTGTAGTYSKIITDDKGRVISGTTLTSTDIIDILGYTPFHPGNDGPGSNLDADLLDGQQGSYYLDAVNLTGILNTEVLPSAVVPGTYTKIGVDANGLVSGVLYADQADIISSLGYTPVPDTGTKIINGTTTLAGDVHLNGETTIYDHLPLLATNNNSILPDQPRGISFVYGGLFSNKTGVLAYYPANDELKLVTNVFASGADTENGDEDDLNGGDADSVYVVSNLDGDASVVLLRSVADSLYVKTKGNEEIAGQKVFTDNVTFRKQIYINDPVGNVDPPFNVSSNTRLVSNLNVDLLDGQHGSYYTNAANATGQFTYTKVTFDHIQGTNTYIPKFNDNINDPASKIDDSIIYQNAQGDIILDGNQNLIVGSGTVVNATSSISIGQKNLIDGSNNLVVGTDNAITGNNSIALNSDSKVNANNSVALGDHGYADIANQLAFGAFNYNDPATQARLEHAQHSQITMYLKGVEAGSTWRSLTPNVTIPDNKTFAYNLELLITRAFGTGVAQYEFMSGIFKNATFRSSNNFTQIVNLTTHPQQAKKRELFNNSQIKNHYHTFSHTNGDRQQQDVRVTHKPIQNNDITIQNAENYYLYTKNYTNISGSYYKTNNGDLILDINEPQHSGNFTMDGTTNKGIKIRSLNHGIKVGSKIDLRFEHETAHTLVDKSYNVYSVVGNDEIYVARPYYTGIINYYERESINYADIVIDSKSIVALDAVDGEYYSSGLFANADSIFFNTSQEGDRSHNSFEIHHNYTDYRGNASILISGINVGSRETYPSGRFVETVPQINNSGSVFLPHKNVIDGNFESERTIFPTHECFYTRHKNSHGDDQLTVYTTGVENPIDITYQPVQYELVSGYLDDDNGLFDIVNNKDRFFLVSKDPLDYETKNVYKVRLKAFDYVANKFFEKNATITVNDTKAPWSHINIPDQTVDISETYNYQIPANIFNAEDDEGSITLSAELQGNADGSALPSWLTFNAATRTLNGTPDGCDIGTYNVRIHATNNAAEIYQDFFITVTDNVYQIFDYFHGDNDNITDILLSSTTIDENLPSGSVVSKLDCVGSYNPYFEFKTATNSFSGIFEKDYNFVECLDIINDFSNVSITGSSKHLAVPSIVDIDGVSADYTVVNRYAPFNMSGTPGLSDGKIYFVDSYQDNNNVFFSGQVLKASGSTELPSKFTLNGFNDYSASFEDVRTTLKTEDSTLDQANEILAENGDHIVTHHGFLPMFMSTESSNRELGTITGITSEASGQFAEHPVTGLQRFAIADPFNTNVLWASGYPNCTDRDLIENATVSYTDRTGDPALIDVTGNLQNFNAPPTGDLKRSNIKYDRDTFAIRDSIENPVIALYGIGLDKFDRFLAENNDILTAENTDTFISYDPKHYGTRIQINTPYELFDSYRTVKANGRLMVDTFDFLVAENAEAIVHDYAIAARSGDACLVFPGAIDNKNVIFEYEETVDQSDDVYNYYYNWGKLIQFAFGTDKHFIKLSEPYPYSATKRRVTYAETLPTNDNLPISGLRTHSYPQASGCGITYEPGIRGFESSHATTGHYVTGLVDVYTQAGTGVINLNLNKDINLDTRQKHNIYAYNFASSNASLDLPIVGQYTGIKIIDADTIQIHNKYFMPNSGTQSVLSSHRQGTFTANVNQGHNYKEELDTIINRVPVEFADVRTQWKPTLSTNPTVVVNSTSETLRPKDYTFDVVNVTGNKIAVKDNKNYFLKEAGRPDYYDQAVRGTYLTNGIAFSGSLFNNHKNIYDIRYNSKYLNHIYKLVNFEYDHSSNMFSFVTKSGVIQPFDNVKVSFPTGFAYYSDPLITLIDDTMIGRKTGLRDLEPLKDNMLLESSVTLETTADSEDIVFTGLMSAGKDAAGTCTIDNSLINRLQTGLLINHADSDKYGYEIDSVVTGFIFSGVVPRNNNVLSANISSSLDANHLGHASVFATGSDALYEGSRLVREARDDEIGGAEYYCISSNINQFDIPADVTGIGHRTNPYYNHLSAVSNKGQYFEFIYLGHNSNTITIQGNYQISGCTTGLLVHHTTFAEQSERYRDLLNRNAPGGMYQTLVKTVGVAPGLDAIDSSIDLTLNVNRFDKIKVQLNPSVNHNKYKNQFTLTTKVVSDVSIKPYILENSTVLNTGVDYFPYLNPNDAELVYTPVPTLDANDCIDCDTKLPQYIPATDPNYRSLLSQDWHILPYIKTNNLYCGNDKKNEQVFYNGNLIKISKFNTIKSFLNQDDEFLINRFNNINISDSGVARHAIKFNATNQSGTISGIVTEGPRGIPSRPTTPGLGDVSWHFLYENKARHQTPLGVSHNQLLPKRGIVDFTKTTSGLFSVLNYNNIYYNTYGGVSSRHPLDIDGKLVNTPQTGTYQVMFDTDTCMSGTLCVTISGISTAPFAGIQPGDTMFFDFDDEAPELTKAYPVKDLISPNALTISPPFDSDLINRSGLVYIINSTQNIKGHLNPNLDNSLILSEGNVDGLSSIDKKIFNYFDNESKGWKHTFHLRGAQPEPTGHTFKLQGSSASISSTSKLYSILDQTIQITGIQYRLNDNASFEPLVNNTLSIPDNVEEVTFKVGTKDGDLSLYSGVRHSIPKVSLSGIGSYKVDFSNPTEFNFIKNTGWNIGLKWDPPKEDYTNKNIILKVSDLTGDAEQNISISKYKIPKISSFYPTGYHESGQMWQVGFDITKMDVTTRLQAQDIFLELVNMPDSNNYKTVHSDTNCVIFSGDTRGADTGIYNLQLTVKDLTTTPYTTLGIATGVISVLKNGADRDPYTIEFNRFDTPYYLDIDQQEKFKFSIPAELGPVPSEVTNNLNITFNTDADINLSLDNAGWNADTKRFDVTATPKTVGSSPTYKDVSARYVNQSLTVSIKQAVFDSAGNYTYQTYTRNIGFNLTLYKNAFFEGIPQTTTIPFTTNEPWSMEFYIVSGVGEHDASARPNASIFKAPNLGTYDQTIPQYSLNYTYEADIKKWKVEAVGTLDALGRFIANTGTYPISVYVDDGLTSNSTNDDYSIQYNSFTKLKNIAANVYTTPDNEFYTKAEVFDLNESASNDISFPATLKESSISLPTNKLTRKYDRHLNTWTNSYTSNPMTDKYDARFTLQGNTIKVDVQGIGKDKIIAVAKLSTMEIESNELDGIPLKITGINGYTPGGAINVDQGDESWKLEFKTIGGLAHANYPPTILLQDMPTFCTGYNPLIETQLQCISEPPTWNPGDQGGSWNYKFSGLPSCVLLGRKDFTITAIDTDTSLLPNSPYLPNTDQVPFAYNYIEGVFDGNSPVITVNDGYQGMDKILPFCGTYYTKQLDFKPGGTGLCINVTGIKSYVVEGSVPPGLSYSTYFPAPGDVPVAPYSNMGHGYLKVQGDVTAFGPYTESLKLTVTDARDKTATQTITFTDSSVANDPDIGMTVYFKDENIALTPKTGLKTLAGTQNVGRPPTIAETLQCLSVLPQNKCGVSEVLYSGTINTNDLDIYLHQTGENLPNNQKISAGDQIYIGFGPHNNGNDGSYVIANDSIGLHVVGSESLQYPGQVAPITGHALIIKGDTKSLNLDDFDNFFEGNIISNTQYCILGGGVAAFDRLPNSTSTKRGLLGAMLPSFKAAVTGLQPFQSISDLRLDRINSDVDIKSTVSWSDCYQTGNVYISGIAVPNIHAEVVDPPPAQDYFFSFNGARFALATRLAFGETESQRLLQGNQRTSSLAYDIIDVLSGVSIQNGTVGAGSSFDTNILSRESGTVYKLTISKGSDIFPTYNYQATPESKNEYVWSHKGDNLTTVPTQNTFPPLATVGFESISVVNSLTDADPNGVVMEPLIGVAVGGYVPTNAGIGDAIPYSHSGNISVSGAYSMEDFLPKITGVIQKHLLKDNLSATQASYTHNNTTLKISGVNPVVGDIVSVEFYDKPTYGNPALQYSDTITVAANNIDTHYLSLNVSLGNSNINGTANANFAVAVHKVDLADNELVLSGNFNCTVGDNIGVDKNRFISTELNLLEENGYITMVSGNNGLVFLGNTNSQTGWLTGFGANDAVSVHQNIDDNIKIMPENTVYNTEGKYTFQITGRSNTRENEDLVFKIAAMDNKDTPVFDTATYPHVGLNPKKYFTNYPLYVSKPIAIVPSTVNKNGDQLTFSISGGKRPLNMHSPDIQIAAGINGDFDYCGFYRNSTGTGSIPVDVYNSSTDRLDVTLTLSSLYGIDWSVHDTVKIHVSDETGSDNYTHTY
tara:strand:- start:14543 stop:27904 length:13362 start_codon:yes stop_codon:yes gene_type:complete